MLEMVDQSPRKKVAIVGFAPSWNLAPYEDESFDIWGINELYLQAVNKRFTAWFEIHNPKSPSKKVETHQKWLTECKIPLYMQEHYDKYPMSTPYPRETVKKMVNNNFVLDGEGSPYTDFSNQITWMVLLAILKNYDEIHVYGVDMAQQSEYAWQRSACQFAIGFAVGRGIKVLIPKTSELCKYPRDYGFDTDNVNRFMAKDRVKSLKQMSMQYQTQMYDIEYQYNIKHDDFVLFRKNAEASLIKMGDEIIKLELMTAKNNEIMNFLTTMPQDMKTINEKKTEILENIVKQNEVMSQSIKVMETQAKELKAKLENESKIDFMNAKVLEQSKKNLENHIITASGAVGECNYNLNNNRV
jgi:hypothetical protein